MKEREEKSKEERGVDKVNGYKLIVYHIGRLKYKDK